MSSSNSARPRIGFFDSLRGFTIVSMVCFHAAYDAAYLYGIDLPWFRDPVIQNIWRASISWVFLFLAGWMTSLSRNNLKRGLVYAAAALIVYLATTVAGVDTAVSFGILYCMAACTLLFVFTAPLLQRVPPAVGIVCSALLFALTYGIPLSRYPITGLSWLGFPSPTFVSGDYYPLIPFMFMYLVGAWSARFFQKRHGDGYPSWMLRTNIPVLSRIGTLSLPIYLIHQPVLIAIFMLVCGR